VAGEQLGTIGNEWDQYGMKRNKWERSDKKKNSIFIAEWDMGGLMVGFSTALRGQTVGRNMKKSGQVVGQIRINK